MGDKVSVKVGDKVRFSVGRSRTAFEASVIGFENEGKFVVTVDANEIKRKVRPGSCTVL